MLLEQKVTELQNANFSDSNTKELIISIEKIINENYINNNNNPRYFEIISMIGYYYGKTHNYEKSQFWLNKLPEKNFNDNWVVFKNALFPIIISNETEENQIINNLKKKIKLLYNLEKLNIDNLLIMDNSFWYGYIDNNPIEIYQEYVKLQIKAFPSIYSQNLMTYKKNNKIKIGIISGGLEPRSTLNHCNIHSSSISDSFYSTFLNLSKDIFEVIFIYYDKEDPNIENDKNIYIPVVKNTIVDSIEKIQRKIASLNLDILLYIDIHIYSILNLIALTKLAKIQLCTHGHPVTSGIPRDIMNYFISWEAAEIKNAQDHYTEELVLISKNVIWEYYIPRNNNCFSMLTGITWGDKTRKDLDFLPNDIDCDKNWYFCAQATFKFNYKFDIILKNILEKDSNALIFLIKIDKELYHMNTLFKKRLQENNIDLNRIIFLEKMKHHNMMAFYDSIDVALDSFFFGGDTTTREAFEIGTPIITLPHKYLGSRWTQAYYNHIGITELIATDIDNYVDLAIKVGTNKLYSKELRQKIKENSSKLFYSKDATKSWEDVFLKLFDKEKNKYIENEKIENEKNEKIPKIIIQTWKTSNLPLNITHLSNKIKELHPNFEYKFFTDEDIEIFIKENYLEYYNVYNNFKYSIQKFDFFRYLAIYHYGGFYLDIDMKLNLSIEELCKHNCVFPREFKEISDNYLLKNEMNFSIGNYAFGASKKNEFIKFCIDNIVNDSLYSIEDKIDEYHEKYVYYKTGPVLISASYIKYTNKKSIYIIKNEKDCCFGIFAEHLGLGTWKNNKIKILEENTELKGGTQLILERINNRVDISQINIITDTNKLIIDNNKPILYWCHDNITDPLYKFIDKTKHFIFVSEYQKKQFIEYYNLNPTKCFVINNGIIPFPKHNKDKSTCKLIYHSTPHRGLDILIEVFDKLTPYFTNLGINIHLSVYSSFKIYNRVDLDKHYQMLYDRINNHPNMTYYGSVLNKEVREALMTSNIFVYPSTFEETSCMCLIEAMSAGCICVHSSLGALPETSNNKTFMYEYTQDKMEHCTRFANTLIKAVSKYRSISLEDQIEYANNVFNIDTIADKWKDVIKSIVLNDNYIVDTKVKVYNYHNGEPAFFYIYNNCIISNSLKNNIIWRTHLHDIFNKYITSNSIVIEGGCHIGSHTIKLCMLSKHVFAFEPMSSSYDKLEKNIKINNLKNITLFKKGLSNTFNTVHFGWIPSNNPGGYGLSNNPIGKPPWIEEEKNKIYVDLTTIDSLNLDRLDFIKLDIEGYEYFAIDGGIETIKKYKPIITLESWSNHNSGIDINFTKKTFKDLINIGYNIFNIDGPDFLFIPK